MLHSSRDSVCNKDGITSEPDLSILLKFSQTKMDPNWIKIKIFWCNPVLKKGFEGFV